MQGATVESILQQVATLPPGGRLIAHSAGHDEVAAAAKADGAYLPLITFVETKPARPFVRV